MRHLSVLRQAGDLYERAVTSPDAVNDDRLEEWAIEVTGEGAPPSRATAREIRRVLRATRKLRDFWAGPPAGVPSDAGDWRTRVDLALGVRAWRPLLGIAQAGLDEDPSPELFDEARRLFREVHGSGWMEGVGYDEWLSDHRGSRSGDQRS